MEEYLKKYLDLISYKILKTVEVVHEGKTHTLSLVEIECQFDVSTDYRRNIPHLNVEGPKYEVPQGHLDPYQKALDELFSNTEYRLPTKYLTETEKFVNVYSDVGFWYNIF